MIVDVINTAAFFGFLVPLLIGTGATLTRVVSYRLNGEPMPRLLIRDAQVLGGFTVTVSLLLVVRVLRAAGADVSGLGTNIGWVLVTSVPAIWAVLVYAYFEIVVIERGHGATAYRDRERPE